MNNNNTNIQATSAVVDGKKIAVRGTANVAAIDAGTFRWQAAAPNDRRTSYTGSGLPHASITMAFEGTPLSGSIDVSVSGGFSFLVHDIPGSFYAFCGTVLVPPSIKFTWSERGQARAQWLQVAEPIPYRMNTYPNLRTGAEFYDNVWGLPVRSQEAILRSAAYPTDVRSPMPPNHWGPKPAL